MKVLEIGSWKGMATAVMGRVLSDYEGTLFAIDTWKGSSSVPSMEWEAGNTDIFNIFIDNMKILGLLNQVVKPIVMESTAAAQIFQDKSLDFIFIDGDHSYSSLKQDILVWLPKLKEGGTICGHCAEGYYFQYSETVKAEIDRQCELDCIITEEGGLHPGVVKATYEVFGNKYEIMPGTSIWYYQKTAIDAQWSVGSSKPNKLNPYYAAHVKILLNILGETTQEDPNQGSIYQSERIFLIAQYCTQGWNGDLIQLGFQGREATKKLAELAKKSHRRLVIVPLAEAETKEGSSNWEETLFNDIEQYRDVVSIIQPGSLTEDTIESIQHQEFCFAFIDGFETYDTCLTAIKTVACCSGVIAVDNTSESQEISRAFLQGSELANRSKLYLPLCRESYLLWS
jgi:predicted O-methyltransferase YrrM